MLDFAGISPSYSMDGKSWKGAIDEVSGSEENWRDNRCLFFKSSEDCAIPCGCNKFMLLSNTMPEEANSSGNG